MCNYAVNCLSFYGRDFSMVQDIFNKITSCYNNANGNKNSVRCFFNKYNYGERFINTMTDGRDYFSHCDTTIVKKDNVFMFGCETNTAWSENMEGFFALMLDHYKNKVNLSFISEEPGGDIYVYKDDTGLFYPDRFKADFCVNENYHTEYFSEYSDLIDYLKEHFPKAEISLYDHIKDLKENIDKVYAGSCDDYFLSINRFKEYTLAEPYMYDPEVA